MCPTRHIFLADSFFSNTKYIALRIYICIHPSTFIIKALNLRLEPNMLKNLPIIPSQTSQIFYPLFFLFLYHHQLFLFYCVSDNVTIQG